MTFDTTINAGNLITILAGILLWGVTLAVAWTRFGGRIDILEWRIESVEKTLIRITDVLEKFTANEKEMALIEQKLTALQVDHATLHATVEGLRKGDGWIQSQRRGNIDGEYTR